MKQLTARHSKGKKAQCSVEEVDADARHFGRGWIPEPRGKKDKGRERLVQSCRMRAIGRAKSSVRGLLNSPRPAGTASNFGATSTISTDFAFIQALCRTLINGSGTYPFVATVRMTSCSRQGHGEGHHGCLKLAAAETAGAVQHTGIAHAALA